ncbi:hypothetical protein P691DRAFT_805583 [Macrolepiota fuliginosa MF-IS2]|uniref:Uncharacterized protein n=1 Tax=Macrolepiota fuliginosa MF-IS2 TaxID=1400762 RepID=A0A9P5X6J9_9AGAR|nr:hypothetical protein P691DRAFT_805583 [Macrolepiota fuliginosa MF-IS2]
MRVQNSRHGSSPQRSEGSSDQSTDETPKVTRKHRNRRPFGRRIYEAAIASHVDPILTLIQSRNTPASKPPLRFEPISSPSLKRRERGTVAIGVAKRNTLPISCFSHSSNSNSVRFPVTRWQTILEPKDQQVHGGDQKIQKRLPSYGGGRQRISSSLDFVPLSQAESAYKAMFSPSIER